MRSHRHGMNEARTGLFISINQYAKESRPGNAKGVIRLDKRAFSYHVSRTRACVIRGSPLEVDGRLRSDRFGDTPVMKIKVYRVVVRPQV